MPDLFQGDPVKLNPAEGFDIMHWLQKGGPEGKGHLPDSVDPIVEKTLAYMKEQGAKKIGAVGYCFGGKYVARFLAKGKGVDVGYTAHPSFVDEDEIKGMAGPLSIAAAGTLYTFRTIRRDITNQFPSQRPTTSSPKTSATRPSSCSRR
jgi:dienelactone hydrolase